MQKSARETRTASALVVGICVLANMVDGFDVLAIAFTGPAIMKDWGLGPGTLGLLFSAGLAGVMLGSLAISPLADSFGRRRVALSCLFAMAMGMLASAAAQNAGQLIALRLFTGLGIGGVLATLNTIVAEVSSPRQRNLTMSIFSMGYPLGSTIGGLLAVALISAHGWQSIFLIGGLGTLVVFLLHLVWLPESARRGATQRRVPFAALLSPALRGGTLAICAAFFLNMISFYFVLNWTPKLVEALGLPVATGMTATVLLNTGSLIGGVTYGVLADRFGWRRVGQGYFLGFAAFVLLFALTGASVAILFAIAFLAGIFMAGAMTVLYVLAPAIFPGELRATGTGLAIGIGRAGATLGPVLAGYALAGGLARGALYLLFALPPLAVALIVRRVRAPTLEG